MGLANDSDCQVEEMAFDHLTSSEARTREMRVERKMRVKEKCEWKGCDSEREMRVERICEWKN